MGHFFVCTHFIKMNRLRVIKPWKYAKYGTKSLITREKKFSGTCDQAKSKDRQILYKKKFG